MDTQDSTTMDTQDSTTMDTQDSTIKARMARAKARKWNEPGIEYGQYRWAMDGDARDDILDLQAQGRGLAAAHLGEVAKGDCDRVQALIETVQSLHTGVPMDARRGPMSVYALERGVGKAPVVVDPYGRKAVSYSIAHVLPSGVGQLPQGKLPKPVLLRSLVGTTVADAESLVDSLGLCFDGTKAFLEQFGVEYEVEPMPCDYCGHEHDDDSDVFSWIDSFDITEDMLAYIEKEGTTDADAIADALGVDLTPDLDDLGEVDWSPPSGAELDYGVWSFRADICELDGVEDLDVADTVALTRAVDAYVTACAQAGMLPGVPGVLTRTADGTEWLWDPDQGRFANVRTPKGRWVSTPGSGLEIVVEGLGPVRVSERGEIMVPLSSLIEDCESMMLVGVQPKLI